MRRFPGCCHGERMRQSRSRCAFSQNGASLSFDLAPPHVRLAPLITFASRPVLHPGPCVPLSRRCLCRCGCQRAVSRLSNGRVNRACCWASPTGRQAGRGGQGGSLARSASRAAEVGKQRVDSRGSSGHKLTRSFVLTRTNGQFQSSWGGKVHFPPPGQQ